MRVQRRFRTAFARMLVAVAPGGLILNGCIVDPGLEEEAVEIEEEVNADPEAYMYPGGTHKILNCCSYANSHCYECGNTDGVFCCVLELCQVNLCDYASPTTGEYSY